MVAVVGPSLSQLVAAQHLVERAWREPSHVPAFTEERHERWGPWIAYFDRARMTLDGIAQRMGDAQRQETFLAASHPLVVASGPEWKAGVAS